MPLYEQTGAASFWLGTGLYLDEGFGEGLAEGLCDGPFSRFHHGDGLGEGLLDGLPPAFAEGLCEGDGEGFPVNQRASKKRITGFRIVTGLT